MSGGSLHHDLFYPIKRLWWAIWYAPARWIVRYNEKDIPRDRGIEVHQLYLKPLWGMVLVREEGELLSWKWWKKLKKYKYKYAQK